MAKPFAESGTWRDVLQPQIDPRLRLGDAARPDSVDENALTIFRRRRLINPLQSNIDAHSAQSLPCGKSAHLKRCFRIWRIVFKRAFRWITNQNGEFRSGEFRCRNMQGVAYNVQKSEERRVGKEFVSTCRTRGTPSH